MEETFVQRPLFGGAIHIALPTRFDDTSQFREVPDHQEVFSDPDTDQSVIVEIVEFDPSIPDVEIGKFHLDEIAHVSDAAASQFIGVTALTNEQMPNLPPGVVKLVAVGDQRIAKFRETAFNTVRMFVAIIRLPQVASEILITLNTPLHIDQHSSSARARILHPDYAQQLHLRVLQSLAVNDWSLFTPPQPQQ